MSPYLCPGPAIAASCPPLIATPGLSRRIPQSVRILGSLVAILLVFLVTAILVKVQMDALPFFVITMIKIMLINCKLGPGGDGCPDVMSSWDSKA